MNADQIRDKAIINKVLGQLAVYWAGFGDGIRIEIVAPETDYAIIDLIAEAAGMTPALEDREWDDEQCERLRELKSEVATEIKRRLQGVML